MYCRCFYQYRQTKTDTSSTAYIKYSCYKKTYTDCLIEGLKLRLDNNGFVLANENLLQTNGGATGTPNSCSYADIAVACLDQALM